MAMSQGADEDVQVSLLATSGYGGLAANVLAERFGVTLQYAESVLEQGYGLLSPRLGRQKAREALPLLSALGLHVALQPVDSMPPDEFGDISIRLRDFAQATKLVVALERMLGLTGLSATSFIGPQGYVVKHLSSARAEWLCNALRPLTGVICAISEHQTAFYDLFAERKLSANNHAEVKRQLRLMGCGIGGFGDAVGVGLERRVLDRILAQFPNLGLFGIDRAFQRYELLVIGKGALTGQEFADFMMSRPATQAIQPRKLMESLPLRLENWLTRPAAKQFLGDYGSIGIQAETRLVRNNPTTT